MGTGTDNQPAADPTALPTHPDSGVIVTQGVSGFEWQSDPEAGVSGATRLHPQHLTPDQIRAREAAAAS